MAFLTNATRTSQSARIATLTSGADVSLTNGGPPALLVCVPSGALLLCCCYCPASGPHRAAQHKTASAPGWTRVLAAAVRSCKLGGRHADGQAGRAVSSKQPIPFEKG
jgi:hypothetical protein